MNKTRLRQLKIAVLFIQKVKEMGIKVEIDGEHGAWLDDLDYYIKRLYDYEVRRAKGIPSNQHPTKKAR